MIKINKTQMDRIVEQYNEWLSLDRRKGDSLVLPILPKGQKNNILVIETEQL